MKKLNVLQLCHDSKGPFVPICAMYQKSFDPEKYEVHTVFLHDPYCEQHVNSLQGSEVHFLDLKAKSIRGRKLLAALKIAAFCRRNNIDLIIAHRYKAIYIAGIASLFTSIKVWGVAHTPNVFAKPNRKFFLQHICKHINIIGVSNSVTNNVLSTCPTLQDKNRVFSLPNCLDESREGELLSRSEARKALNINSDDYIFGTIGRLVDVKAHDVLLKAYARAKLNDSKLVIIGGGRLRTELLQLATSLHIKEQVLFTGHVPQAARLLKAFDTFVFSSTDDEAFGLAVLEAMMAKVPIVCSNAKGPTEVIGNTGISFRQGNDAELAIKLLEVYQLTPTDLQALAEKAYSRWHTHYSSKAFTKRSLALFAPSEHR
ncbi:MAG: glycosyltransferase [Pseudomonadales bacterium]